MINAFIIITISECELFILIEESLHTIIKYIQHKRLFPSEEIIFHQQG